MDARDRLNILLSDYKFDLSERSKVLIQRAFYDKIYLLNQSPLRQVKFSRLQSESLNKNSAMVRLNRFFGNYKVFLFAPFPTLFPENLSQNQDFQPPFSST